MVSLARTLDSTTSTDTFVAILQNGAHTPNERRHPNEPISVHPGGIEATAYSAGYRLPSDFRSSYSIVPFEEEAPSFSSLAPNFDVYYFLERAIYLLSNRMLDYYDVRQKQQIDELLENLFRRVPHRRDMVIIGLLESNTPSIRAAWEELVRLSHTCRRKDLFVLLMTVGGVRHHRWLDHAVDEYLLYAAGMNCVDIARDLIKIGARCNMDHIFAAIHADSRDCLLFLIEHFELNSVTYNQELGFSNFGYFLLCSIQSGRPQGRVMRSYDWKKELFWSTLDAFLDRGGNVDLIPPEQYSYGTEHALLSQIPKTWHPTLLDLALYHNLDMFHHLVPYSRKASSTITRSGIHLAAKKGDPTFKKFLESSNEPLGDKNRFLELVLAEQFLLSRRHIDFDTVQGLVQFGVDITLPSLQQDVSLLLYRLVLMTHVQGLTEKAMVAMKLLLQKGATIESYTLSAAVADKGLGLLQTLSHFVCDLRNDGALALAKAIALNNFEAVAWLLQNGVDINATVPGKKGRSAIEIALRSPIYLEQVCPLPHGERSPSFKMLQYLFIYRAGLGIRPGDSSEFFLVHDLIRYSRFCAKDIIQLFLDSGVENCPELEASGTLLETCFSQIERGESEALDLFLFFFRQGASVQSGSPLSHLVYHGGSLELIHQVLDAGADINAYSKRPGYRHYRYTPLQAAAARCHMEILSNLLHKGADLNQPAFKCGGRTVLQAACEWNPLSSEEEDRKSELLRFLLGHGADANGPPAMHNGVTALEIAARQGDLRTTILLLGHGADVNARSSWRYDIPLIIRRVYRPLDSAVHQGKLDMVKFLLNAGAISGRPGQTGYDGAIMIAEERKTYDIADVIRDHLASYIQTWGTNPQTLLASKEVETVDRVDQFCDVCHYPM
jgi:ankyrin repeat protein